MEKAYPVLEAKIAVRGIKKKTMAKRMGLSYRAFKDRMDGKCDFKWSEICIMQEEFFPDMTKEDLMRTEA